MAVTDFPTKAAVIVRDDLAVWQRLNVTGFLVSGLIGSAEDRVVGEDYIDADGKHYLPMLVQPLLVLEASAAKLQTVRRRAAERDVPIAIYTAELFSTGHDDANREAVRAVSTDDLISSGWACARHTKTRTRSFADYADTTSHTRDARMGSGDIPERWPRQDARSQADPNLPLPSVKTTDDDRDPVRSRASAPRQYSDPPRVHRSCVLTGEARTARQGSLRSGAARAVAAEQ